MPCRHCYDVRHAMLRYCYACCHRCRCYAADADTPSATPLMLLIIARFFFIICCCFFAAFSLLRLFSPFSHTTLMLRRGHAMLLMMPAAMMPWFTPCLPLPILFAMLIAAFAADFFLPPLPRHTLIAYHALPLIFAIMIAAPYTACRFAAIRHDARRFSLSPRHAIRCFCHAMLLLI